MIPRKRLTSRLWFRVATPVFMLWLIAGFVMYSVVLSTVSEFLDSRINENLNSLARDVFIICNRNLDRLILEGRAGDERYGKIVKVRTLSEIEIILRENNGKAIIYSEMKKDSAPDIVLDMGLPLDRNAAIASTQKEQGFSVVSEGDMTFYAFHIDFDPWDWHILIFKPNTDFMALQARIQRVYIFTLCALTLGALLVVVLLHFLVNRPVSSIIADLEHGQPPSIRGVYELEFLGKTISTMMLSLADMNRQLEQEVEVRTRDLSEKAAQLEIANAKLKELDRMKSAFLSSVSHELRTPLTSVLGFAKMIDRDVLKHVKPLVLEKDDARLEQRVARIMNNLQIIESESERLTRLINDVLDLTRIEDGRMEWSERPVQLHKAASQAVNALSGQVGDKTGVVLRVTVPETLPPLMMDPDRMQQVLLNLLGNALKFTDSGAIVLLGGFTAGEGFRVCIHDSGTGIPRDHLLEVFESFSQARQGDTVSLNQRGTGLGLAICRQIVEHYGGIIWIESGEGQGTRVFMEFPPEIVAL